MVLPLERASDMIDEHSMPAAAAALVAGEPRLCGLAERRVKQGRQPATGGHADDPGDKQVQAPMHHRLTMSAVMTRLAAACHPVRVDDMGFVGLMNRLGAGPAETGA